MTLDKMISELCFDPETEAAILWKIKKNPDEIRKIADTAYCGTDFDFELLRRKPLTRLSAVVWLLLKACEKYRALGVPDETIFDTFRDVSLLSGLHRKSTGKVGITKKDVIWLRHIMNTGIFKIGALQYQPFEMIYLDEEGIGERYMTFSEEQKRLLPTGTPVINCHIQYGANLKPETVEESFEKAKMFFNKCFPDRNFKAFIIYSWIIYPGMMEYLSEDSNIRHFARRFRVIGQCKDSESAFENLFEGGKRRLMEKPTTLQKMALEHPERFGFACGVTVF